MPTLDLATVLVLHQSSLVVGAVSLLLLRFRSDAAPGVVSIACGLAILALGATLAGLGEFAMIPAHIWTDSSLALAVAGYSAVLIGMLRMDAPATRWWPLWLLTPSVLLLGLSFDLFHDNSLRALLFHLTAAASLLVAGLSILRHHLTEPLPSRLPLALCMLAEVLVYGYELPSLAAGNPSLAALTTGFAITLFLNFGIAAFVSSMVRERMEEHHRRISVTDALTGIANRRGFFGRIGDMPRHGDSLAVLDLDWFKRLNDGLGHAAGDAALCAFARLVERRLARGEVFARFGGEEFVIFVPDDSAGRALILAESIRSALAEDGFVWNGQRLPLTVSVGIATAPAGESIWQSILDRADRALYAAKAAGRNRVSIDLGNRSEPTRTPSPSPSTMAEPHFAVMATGT